MSHPQPNNPLHGVTLKEVVTYLVETYGIDRLGELIKIKCFNNDPTLSSSLTFLRKHERARKEVEDLYVRTKEHAE